jgi:hypothetical protein
MELLTLIAISIGLAMDAFAVSIGKGLSVKQIEPRHTMSVGLWFGGFQALMPLVGYFLGVSFASLVQNIDHTTTISEESVYPQLDLVEHIKDICLHYIEYQGNSGRKTLDCVYNTIEEIRNLVTQIASPSVEFILNSLKPLDNLAALLGDQDNTICYQTDC